MVAKMSEEIRFLLRDNLRYAVRGLGVINALVVLFKLVYYLSIVPIIKDYILFFTSDEHGFNRGMALFCILFGYAISVFIRHEERKYNRNRK